MMRRAYQTDLSDAEWIFLEPYLPAPKATGRPKTHSVREILNAIFFYVVRGGCAWRLLPYDFPPWKTVYHYFIKWQLDGTWRRSTLQYGSAFGFATDGILTIPARVSWTASL
jgi:putative transposase